MNPDIVQYVVFIIAALILSWGVIELNKRYFGRRNVDVGSLNTWTNLDTRKADTIGAMKLARMLSSTGTSPNGGTFTMSSQAPLPSH